MLCLLVPENYQVFDFIAFPLNTMIPPLRQATVEYSFNPAVTVGGHPFVLVTNLNSKDLNDNVCQDDLFDQMVTIIDKEDGLDGKTIFMYKFLAELGLLVMVHLHQSSPLQ